MNNSKNILRELDKLPNNPDLTNFETYALSKFGNILYNLFIYNYSKKMWAVEPRELTTEYIRNRIELNNSKTPMFDDLFQGFPVNGYTEFLRKMVIDIPIELNSSEFDESLYDLILFSGRIDELLNLKFGSLEFRSLNYEYVENENWENYNYGTINLPQHFKYIRKVNFKIIHQQIIEESLIQYQEPIASGNGSVPLYPIYTKKNIQIFNKYLKEACKSNYIIPSGRLGLYKYLEMGQAISLAIDMIPLIEKWKDLGPDQRYIEIKKLLIS